jgi:hypothetical protein
MDAVDRSSDGNKSRKILKKKIGSGRELLKRKL